MADATAGWPIDRLGYCLIPNHFHLVIRTHADGDLSRWVRWLLVARAQRYHRHYQATGYVWQGRYYPGLSRLDLKPGSTIDELAKQTRGK